MMGDMREVFDLLREDRRERRDARRKENDAMIRGSGLAWESRSDGASWILRSPGYPRVDFFPDTGRWRDIEHGRTHRGGAVACLGWIKITATISRAENDK